jgi:3-oxoacyl-[acyl-carrier protein] reductase
MDGHTAIVTGANHGIGAATAVALARRGCAVLCTFLRVEDPADPGTPQTYRDHRACDAGPVVAEIQAEGGRAAAIEVDLTDPATPGMLFDAAEEQLGPVDILVNNATGWLADTFAPSAADRLGRSLQPVTAASWGQQFTVDVMAAALLIAEFARRHIARGADWGRIIGLTSGGDLGFPEEVSYGAAKAAQTSYTMSAAVELAPFGITANMVHPPVTDTGWVTEAVRQAVAGKARVLVGAGSVAVQSDGPGNPPVNIGILRREGCVEQLVEPLLDMVCQRHIPRLPIDFSGVLAVVAVPLLQVVPSLHLIDRHRQTSGKVLDGRIAKRTSPYALGVVGMIHTVVSHCGPLDPAASDSSIS